MVFMSCELCLLHESYLYPAPVCGLDLITSGFTTCSSHIGIMSKIPSDPSRGKMPHNGHDILAEVLCSRGRPT